MKLMLAFGRCLRSLMRSNPSTILGKGAKGRERRLTGVVGVAAVAVID